MNPQRRGRPRPYEKTQSAPWPSLPEPATGSCHLQEWAQEDQRNSGMGALILSKFQPTLKEWTNGVHLMAVRLCHPCSDMTPSGQFSAMDQDLQLPQPKTCTPQDLHPLHSLEFPLVYGGCLLVPFHISMLQISSDPWLR